MCYISEHLNTLLYAYILIKLNDAMVKMHDNKSYIVF